MCAQSLTMSFMYEVNKGRTQQYQPFKKQNQSVCHTADLICLSANKHANHIFRCWTVAVKLGWVLCITRSNITEFFTDCTSVSACTFEVFFTRKCESCDGNDDENIWSEVQWRLCCLPSCEATSNMLWKNKNAAIGNMEANLTKLSCETNKTA